MWLAAVFAVACAEGESQQQGDDTPPVDLPDETPPTESPDGGEVEHGPVAEVHRVGRFTDDDRFAWSATSASTRFEGTSISIELTDSGSNRFEVIVDGETQPVLVPHAGTGTYVLAEGLEDGEHEVVVSRRTEALFGESAFGDFTGAKLVPSEGRTRFIEFVGDSITAGFGSLGESAACGLDPETESESAAWGALAADELDADHVAIAHSGKGVYRDGSGDTSDQMPTLYDRILPADPSSTWNGGYTPDVIVVALGTNDFGTGDPGQPFVDAYVGFVETLRERHPDAWILVAESPMLSDVEPAGEMRRTRAREYLEEVVATREDDGDEHIALVEIAEQLPSDGYGCAMHPSAATHVKMADALVARIHEVVGW